MPFSYSGAVLFTKAGMVGLEVRKGTDSNPGRWGLIGGGSELGEVGGEVGDTIDRELREETGKGADAYGIRHIGTMLVPKAVTGRDDLRYSVYQGELPDDEDLDLPDADGMVYVDASDVLAGVHDDRLTPVAAHVLKQVLGE
jgi:8-oxo-dGTP pyrophosphatase MutT (NUDIX family)